MAEIEKVIKGLEILRNGCEYIHCDDCCFYISTKPTRCGLREEQIQEDALAMLKEQKAEIERLKSELHGFGDLFHMLSEKAKEVMAEQSKIVRCKDCRHWIGGGIDSRDNFIPPRCTLFNEPQSADWYCPAGQRKGSE